MAVLTKPKGQSAHWYHRDGTPQHEMPLKSGDGNRPTHLGDARKLGLYPSVSGIIGMLHKSGLEKWKINQAILATLRTPRKEDQPENNYLDMVRDVAFQQVEDAADFGTSIHHEIEKFLRWDWNQGPYVPNPVAADYVRPVIKYMVDKGIKIEKPEIVLVNHEHGFAGTCDAPYRATKSFGILDYKTNKTKPGKAVAEWPEKLLQIAAYNATYWGEAALNNPANWGGNIYISSTERGRTVAIMYNNDMLKRGWEVFKALCGIWRHFNEFDPRLPAGTVQTWPTSITIEIAPPLPPALIESANPATAPAMPAASDETTPKSGTTANPATEPGFTPPVSTNSSDATPTTPVSPPTTQELILTAAKLEDEKDGIRFLSPSTCAGFTPGKIKSIYAWWYHAETNTARVEFASDASMLEHGWRRAFTAYPKDLDHVDRAEGKKDPVVGTNGLPVKPAGDEKTNYGGKLNEHAVVTAAIDATKEMERISVLEGMVLGFGKHKKLTLKEAPGNYLMWCIKQLAKANHGFPPHVVEYLSISVVKRAVEMDKDEE